MRIAALLLLASVILPAQTPSTQEAPPPLRITVTLVQVDVVVTDSNGRRVTNLAPEDFEILQDGKPQSLKLFSYTPEIPSRPPEPTVGTGPPPPITPGQVKRAIALVVDDLALSFENLVRAREALKRYVERQMAPGDLVAIVRTGGGIVALEQFTTDRRLLLSAIDLLKWRFRGRCGVMPVARTGAEGSHKPEVIDHGCSLSALGSLATLEQVIAGMKRLPGRKSVVFMSDNLRMNLDIQAAMDHLTDLSNRAAVTIYTVDPGGLRVDSKFAAEQSAMSSPSTGSMLGDLMAERSEEAAQYLEGLTYLARRTGGLFFTNNNDIPGCIRQAADDQLGYYLLGYTPPEGTFEVDSDKAKFRRLMVKVRRPGLHVRWKSGFNGVKDELLLTELDRPKTRERQISDALASPFTADGIKVRITSMFTHYGKQGPGVRSLLHFDAKDLTFTRDGDEWRATADIVAIAYRGVNQHFVQHEKVESIRLSDDLYQRALKEGFLLVLDHGMKEPGPFVLRAVVRDTASEKLGSASQFVEVPDTRKGRFAISGILIKLADADILRALTINPNLASDNAHGEPWSEGGPATRRYRPGQNIVYSYLVLNPKMTGKPKATNIGAQVRVFRDGKQIYAGEENVLTTDALIDDQRYVGAGVLKLGAALIPGEYLMQVTVRDRNRGRKHSQAAQWIDFEVSARPSS